MNISDKVDALSMSLNVLIEKAELWQNLFDECPLAIVVFNSDLRVYLVNAEFCNLIGYSHNEITGEKLSKLIPNNFKKMHKQKEKEFISSPRKRTSIHGVNPYILTKDGQVIKVSIDLSFFIHGVNIFYVAFIKKGENVIDNNTVASDR